MALLKSTLTTREGRFGGVGGVCILRHKQSSRNSKEGNLTNKKQGACISAPTYPPTIRMSHPDRGDKTMLGVTRMGPGHKLPDHVLITRFLNKYRLRMFGTHPLRFSNTSSAATMLQKQQYSPTTPTHPAIPMLSRRPLPLKKSHVQICDRKIECIECITSMHSSVLFCHGH